MASTSLWPVKTPIARWLSEPVSIWAPPESPLQIEYSPALLREVCIADGGVDAFGVLYGVRDGNTVRLVATCGCDGLEPVGIYAARVRGQVFLTEDDLERFEKADSSVALVTSGETGGFFVRDASGSIDAVRSYQEFSIPGAAPGKRRSSWRWCWLLLPVLCCFLPRRHPPLEVRLHEDSGQLRISWNAPVQANLRIVDAGERTSIAISPGISAITYARRSGDVIAEIGSAEARFVGPALLPDERETERAAIAALESEIVLLRAAHAAGQVKIAALRRRLQ